MMMIICYLQSKMCVILKYLQKCVYLFVSLIMDINWDGDGLIGNQILYQVNVKGWRVLQHVQ